MSGLISDLVGLVGLLIMGYGLYLYAPWVCFTVCGGVLLVLAVWRELVGVNVSNGSEKEKQHN